ncbi:MAG: hypothetical protein KGJ13_07130 [Patescibacteria group bacterium]|nr:hypothetical protein [Patescibacteria group bacterium]
MFGSTAAGKAGTVDNSTAYIMGEYATPDECVTAALTMGYNIPRQSATAVAVHCEAFSDPSTEKQANGS